MSSGIRFWKESCIYLNLNCAACQACQSFLPEQRVQVKLTRFRIPDVCILLGDTDEQILTKPPFLCIEVLSPVDSWARVKARIDDFLAMGVPYVWVIDPKTRQAYIATPAECLREVTDGILKTENPAFHVPVADLLT